MSKKSEDEIYFTPIMNGDRRWFNPPVTVVVTFQDSPEILVSEVTGAQRIDDGYWLTQADGAGCEICPGYTHLEFNPPGRDNEQR